MNEVQILSIFILILLMYTAKNIRKTNKECNLSYKIPHEEKKSNVEKFQFEEFDNDPVNDRVNEFFLQNFDDSVNYTEGLWNTTESQEHTEGLSNGFDVTTPDYINEMNENINELYATGNTVSRVSNFVVEAAPLISESYTTDNSRYVI